MVNTDVRESAKQMLCTEIMENNVVFDGDDYQTREKVKVGGFVYLDCAFYDNGRGYIWEIKGQTTKKGLLTGAPTPSDGATAVVRCDVAEKIDGDKVRLNNPIVIEFHMNAATSEKLEERI